MIIILAPPQNGQEIQGLYRLFSMAPKPFDPRSFDPTKKPSNWTKGWVQHGLGLDNQGWGEIENTVVDIKEVEEYTPNR